MDWLIPIIAIFGAVGVLWALRDYFTGSKIIDDRNPDERQTEAQREALRAQDQTHL